LAQSSLIPYPSSLLFISVFAILLLASCGRDKSQSNYGGAVAIGHAGRQPGQFTKPRALAITAAGEIAVIDRSGRVQFFEAESGEFIRQWRLAEYSNGTPTGMSVDPVNDSLWIADTHYSRILNYNKEGELLFSFGVNGEGPGQMIFPTDAVPDPDGHTLWVTEYGRANRIMRFTREGVFEKEWGSPVYESDELLRPMALSVSPDGKSLYVVDAGNHRIVVYDREGNVLRRFGHLGKDWGAMKYPLDMAMAADGSVFVLEYETARISHHSPDGKFLGSWGEPGKKLGQLFLPWGIAVGPGGEMVIADTNNQRLQLLRNPVRFFRGEAPGGVASAVAESVASLFDSAGSAQ